MPSSDSWGARDRWRWGVAAILIGAAYGVILRHPPWYWPGMTVLMGGLGAWAFWAGRGLLYPGLKPSFQATLLGIGWGLAFYAGAWAIDATLGTRFPPLTSGLTVILQGAAGIPLGGQLLAITVISVGEELFWRRFLLDRLYHFGIRSWPAALGVSTLLYASVHAFSGNPWLAIAALGFGLGWGAIALRTHNSWVAIVSHVVYDALMFVWLKLPGY